MPVSTFGKKIEFKKFLKFSKKYNLKYYLTQQHAMILKFLIFEKK